MLDHDRDHQREKKCVPLDIHPKGTKIFIEGNLYPFEFRTEIHRRGSLFLKAKACFRFGEWTEFESWANISSRILLMRIWKLGNLSPAKEFFFKSRSKSCFLSLFESWLHAKRHKRLTVFWNLSNSVREFQKRKKTKLDKENENQKERSKPSKEQKSFLQNFSLNGLVFYWSEGRKIIGDLQILCDNSPTGEFSHSFPFSVQGADYFR